MFEILIIMSITCLKKVCRLPVRAITSESWKHAGDWSMKWAALSNVSFPTENTRLITSGQAIILETLTERDDNKMFYSWDFTEHPEGWNCGSNLKGSLGVLTEDDKVFVEYSMQADVKEGEEFEKADSLLQHEVDSVAAKLVAYIEANK